MTPKKKKQDENEEKQASGYIPIFSPDFKADLAWWYSQDPKKGNKILDLVADILDGKPFTGLGKPEPLKYIAADTWSRRIDLEHRLVYKVTENKVYFLQALYHYESD
ncbi:Txe/YoeB family addiction module toxin [Anabaena sp. PCC 7108]|uniref:Txe/YoeB family addiction module toxin n=1 Tax=Anabaena sp. PCC 7108 TaxID=163908 RepID=UPI0003461794|nr:Txe/YoeB family addiction module toxin [Anabaena sp. PCC 7108]